MEEKRTFCREIRVTANLIKRGLSQQCIFNQLEDMTGTHGWIIKYLYDNRDRDVYQRDIENEFSIRRSTVTGIIKLMEKNGLIQRDSVENDARLKKLTLTEKAVCLHNAVENSMFQFEKELNEGITKEEEETFYRVMDKIKKNLNKSN